MNHPSPMAYFGSKRKVADVIWERFGDPQNYIEPFFGSGACLFARPKWGGGRIETVNDFSGLVSNFWRAVAADPHSVARYCNWPCIESDLHARHWWLMTEGVKRLETILADPEGYCAKTAGWWVWGKNHSIGTGWCLGTGAWTQEGGVWTKNGKDSEVGVSRQLPDLGNFGAGVNTKKTEEEIVAWLKEYSVRLRGVRIASGDFERVLTSSVTVRHGVTAVLLDPPYGSPCTQAYANADASISRRAAQWAREKGEDPRYRIALCGYEGEHVMPGWSVYEWKADGGYSVQGNGTLAQENAHKERIWFSPHCLNFNTEEPW